MKYDLISLGGGSSGIACALKAAQLGKKVCIVEKAKLGGTQLHNGFIKKSIIQSALQVYNDLRSSAQYSLFTERKRGKWNTVQVNWRTLNKTFTEYAKSKEKQIESALENANVKVINGTASFLGQHRIKITQGEEKVDEIVGDNILIATGTTHKFPTIPGIEFAVSTDEIFNIKKIPLKIAIIGGGPSSMETAFFLATLGAQVKMSFFRDTIAFTYDKDITKIAMDILKKKEILLFDAAVAFEINKLPSKAFKIKIAHGNCRCIDGDIVICETARKPNIEDLKLENAGVILSKDGTIKVDEYDETNKKKIFAIGGVAKKNPYRLAASNASLLLGERLFGQGIKMKEEYKMNYKFIPSSILIDPPMARCGYTEEEAIERFGEDNITVYKRNGYQLSQALINKPDQYFIKIICKKNIGNEKVIGLHGIGRQVDDAIKGFSFAMRKGLTKEDLLSGFGVHTSGAEEFIKAVQNCF